MKIKLFPALVLISSTIFLSACGSKPATKAPTAVNQAAASPKAIDLPAGERPYISLTPREDGHMLYFKLTNVPSSVKQIEYDLVYQAVDSQTGNEIEKGTGDTIKDISSTLSRDFLLGTESCTHGCKYSYDNGVVGGTLTLSFYTNNGISTFDAPFVFKQGPAALSVDNITLKSNSKDKNFYVLLKNYAVPQKSGYKTTYSVFSSGASAAKYTSLDPTGLSKADASLTGDYYLP